MCFLGEGLDLGRFLYNLILEIIGNMNVIEYEKIMIFCMNIFLFKILFILIRMCFFLKSFKSVIFFVNFYFIDYNFE